MPAAAEEAGQGGGKGVSRVVFPLKVPVSPPAPLHTYWQPSPCPLQRGGKGKKKEQLGMNWGKTAGLSHSSESSVSGQGPPEPSPGTVTLSIVCQHPWRVSIARQEGFLVAKEAEARAKACGELGEGAAWRGNGTKGGPWNPRGMRPKRSLPAQGWLRVNDRTRGGSLRGGLAPRNVLGSRVSLVNPHLQPPCCGPQKVRLVLGRIAPSCCCFPTLCAQGWCFPEM